MARHARVPKVSERIDPVSRHIPHATRPIVLPTSLLCWSNSLIVFTPPEGDFHDESVSATKTRVRGELPPRPGLPLYLSLLDTRCMLFDQPSSHNSSVARDRSFVTDHRRRTIVSCGSPVLLPCLVKDPFAHCAALPQTVTTHPGRSGWGFGRSPAPHLLSDGHPRQSWSLMRAPTVKADTRTSFPPIHPKANMCDLRHPDMKRYPSPMEPSTSRTRREAT